MTKSSVTKSVAMVADVIAGADSSASRRPLAQPAGS